jgi:hypothetical protein
MGELKAYAGGCQCGKVRYEVQLDLGAPVISCNCSMCGRAGTLLTFVPARQFKLLSGEDALTDYQFNKLPGRRRDRPAERPTLRRPQPLAKPARSAVEGTGNSIPQGSYFGPTPDMIALASDDVESSE